MVLVMRHHAGAHPLNSIEGATYGRSIRVTTSSARTSRVLDLRLPVAMDLQLSLSVTPAEIPPGIPPFADSKIAGWFLVTWGSGEVNAHQVWLDCAHGITIPLHAQNVTVDVLPANVLAPCDVNASIGPASTRNSNPTFTAPRTADLAPTASVTSWIPPFAQTLTLWAEAFGGVTPTSARVVFIGVGGEIGRVDIPDLTKSPTINVPGNALQYEIVNTDGGMLDQNFTASFQLAL